MEYITMIRERNRRFTAALRKKMAQERLEKATNAVINQVLNEPVERGFFVSVDHIIVMDRLRREGKMPPLKEIKRQMWEEIFSIFDQFLQRNPEETLTEAAIHVVSRGRASRFYITGATAQKIIKTL
ncbi:MAG: hypothetical protein NC301_02535 [Bacteroides sp.]|nr:hypothetical protein [Bacteroides sp.]MCM1379609.1 hypothetical protein [Bacteroides sp.]MCM1446009.1 hypothetical protein [Prevotella sp.]